MKVKRFLLEKFDGNIDVRHIPSVMMQPNLAKKIKEYVFHHQERYSFQDYGLGDRKAIYVPRPILCHMESITNGHGLEYLFVMSDKGSYAIEIDFFYTFLRASGQVAQKLINEYDTGLLNIAFSIIEKQNGMWSIGD